ncbi:MAG: MgtC/SapB family protein [Anaerolineae bacterium]|nr:MgtC/SapB family protein [Anaerolineae bacterium]
MTISTEDMLKLAVALLVGGVIGAEREFRDKSAGFRTIIFITLGATLFTMLSFHLWNDSARVAANIVTGIGFLGAGAILHGNGGKVTGLTTASTIWLAAALGMGIGGGLYLLVGVSTLTVLIVLWVFPLFERWLDNLHDTHTYEIVLPLGSSHLAKLEQIFRNCGIRVYTQSVHKQGDRIVYTLRTVGRKRCHRRLIPALIENTEVIEFRY